MTAHTRRSRRPLHYGNSANRPQWLEPYGPVESLLKKAIATPGADEIRSDALKFLRLVRDEFDETSPTVETAQNIRIALSAAYRSDDSQAVISACLGFLARDHEFVDHVWRCAVNQFEKNSNLYDEALETLVPYQLHREMHAQRYHFGDPQLASDDLLYVVDRLFAQRSENVSLGIPTGIEGYDALSGGLRGMVILGGDSGIGKTSLVMHMLRHALRVDRKLGALFLSLDMSRRELYDRLICAETGVHWRDLRDGSKRFPPHFDDRLVALRTEVLSGMMILGSLPQKETARSLANAILEQYRKAQQKIGAQKMVIVLDLLQRLPTPDGMQESLAADHFRLDALQTLQSLTQCYDQAEGATLLVLSEVRKTDRDGQAVHQHDLRGSASIAYHADQVLLLSHDATRAPTPTSTPVLLTISKGRDGVTRGSVPLSFNFETFTFDEPAPPSNSDLVRTPASSRYAQQVVSPLAGGRP